MCRMASVISSKSLSEVKLSSTSVWFTSLKIQKEENVIIMAKNKATKMRYLFGLEELRIGFITEGNEISDFGDDW